MVHSITVLGDWVLKNVWHFTVDQMKGCKLIVLEDEMWYAGLLQIVEEEYQLDTSVHNIQLSYALPQIMLGNMPNKTPPVILTSDRQVRNFIEICKSNSVQLCVSVKSKGQQNSQVPVVNELFATSSENPKVQIADALYGTSGDIRRHVDLGNDNDKDDGGDDNFLSSNNTDIKGGEYFKSKYELQQRLWMLSVKYKFGWKVSKSDTKKFVVVCKNNGCSWRVRATTKDETAEYFWIRKYIDVHTCSAEERIFSLGSITLKIIGQLILDLFGGISHGLKPRDLEKPLLKNYGLTLTYHQLWDALEQARELLRGSHESGYEQLPKYIYKIKKANPGTIADLKLVGNQRFKYLFFAFGQCLRGFEFMRKVIAVDVTFLKGKFRGTLIVATAQDGDNHIYPLAFGIIDSENDAAWEWFFSRLKSVIPDNPNLVFISDRHESIEKAIEKVFPSANRGICFFHLEKNIKTNFGANQLFHLVNKAGNTYRRDVFTNVMNELRHLNPKLCKYFEDADIRLWSTAHFQGNRYNITTSNIAESINGLLKEAREYPIVAFLDHVRATLTRWFYERRHKAAKLVTELGPYADGDIGKIREEANTLGVQAINQNQFHVTGGSEDAVVDMQKLSCSCRKFDIMKIPCMHAIAVATKNMIPEHTLSDPCYTRSYLFAAYSESIYPVQGILNDIQIPHEVEEMQCLPPQGRRRSGRPKKKRIQSSLEIAMENKRPRKEHKCSRCKLSGHNKKTCETPLP